MAEIHSSAVVDRGAEIDADAVIGPYCVIGPQVVIASGCRLVAHVHVSGCTTIGARTVIQPFTSLGTPPQSVKYRGGATRLVIGSDCDLREAVTMNIGTEDGGGLTEVGDRCFFMVNAHVGHDCRVGNDVTFANNAVLGGHVVIGDHTFIGGQSAVHQFARVGEGAIYEFYQTVSNAISIPVMIQDAPVAGTPTPTGAQYHRDAAPRIRAGADACHPARLSHFVFRPGVFATRSTPWRRNLPAMPMSPK
jgi:acyl-ACP--UDP-N-acetylglucosamine O-acyltransferase